MYIVQITSEVAPIAKAGGLADVILGLSRSIHRLGHETTILLPHYACIDPQAIAISQEKTVFSVDFDRQKWANYAKKALLENDVPLVLLDSEKPLFNRPEIYGYEDDVERFLYFAKSALSYLKSQEKKVDILHVHDWEASPVAFLVKEPEFREFFAKTKVVLTIHNMEYQGKTSSEVFSKLDVNLPREALYDQSGCVNLLKTGIVYSDAVVTVSPTYAQEIVSGEGAKGLLEPILEAKGRFQGILNGLDYDYWNPETDPFFPAHYSKEALDGKTETKKAILQELGLDADVAKPLLVSIGRLVPQKGLDLLKYALLKAEQMGIFYVMMGTAYDPETKEEFLHLEKNYASHPHIRIVLQVNERLAHRLYAASDLFIVPSLFEPCGLTQMIALRYGSVPIVRKTGGLIDTVFDIEYSDKSLEKRNGFVFDYSDSGGIDFALGRAVDLYRKNPQEFAALRLRGMYNDYSWKKPADEYVALFSALISKEFE